MSPVEVQLRAVTAYAISGACALGMSQGGGEAPHVVQAIARHADLEVTMKIYGHTNLDTMREALDKVDRDAE